MLTCRDHLTSLVSVDAQNGSRSRRGHMTRGLTRKITFNLGKVLLRVSRISLGLQKSRFGRLNLRPTSASTWSRSASSPTRFAWASLTAACSVLYMA